MNVMPRQISEAREWVNGAGGDTTAYFRGALAKACYGRSPEAQAAAALRDEYWRAYEHGLITLVQRKHSDGDYSYIAQRIRRT